MADMVEVIQADREAAIRIHRKRRGTRNLVQNIRDGYVDDDDLVQEFARHRVSSASTPIEAIEIVKGLLATADCEFPACAPWRERAERLLGESAFDEAFHRGQAPAVQGDG